MRARRATLGPTAESPTASDRYLGTVLPPESDRPKFGTAAVPHTMLYIVSDVDDPGFRAAISLYTGGAVDYFDGRAGTPSAVTLAGYDCVYVHANFPFMDRVLMGDRLADYVDAGGKVILGIACTYQILSVARLGGRIMDSGYNPVHSPTLSIDFSADAYAGDGTSDYVAGVLSLTMNAQDEVALQGPGVADGSYVGGEILLAYRPDGRVVYVNGTGHSSFAGTGDWAKIVANACWLEGHDAGSMLWVAAHADDDDFRSDVAAIGGGVVDYFDATMGTPTPALLNTYDCVLTNSGLPYLEPILLGDRLADYVDLGRRVILGLGTRYAGFSIGGRIATSDYSPVFNPASLLHAIAPEPDLGDGTGPLFAGVSALGTEYREYLDVQGAGRVNGHYQDGEILAAQRPDGRVVFLNGSGYFEAGPTGDWAQLVYNACSADLSSGHKILCAPSDGDDPLYRAQIAAQTGGIVDYFDANSGTPSLALLMDYDCVYTWADNCYAEGDLFGDRLADYVDAGGTVVLGVFTTYDGGCGTSTGRALAGRIMEPGYSPVQSPAGTNHFSLSAYSGNGTTCLQHRVLTFDCGFRDVLVTQGDGLADALYNDGEIAVAYRPDRRVIYLNGLGNPFGGAGDWPILVANACECEIGPGHLYGSSNDGTLFRLDLVTGQGYLVGSLPAGATEIEYDPDAGRAWMQASGPGFSAYEFSLANGSAIAGPIANGAAFNAMEYALGRMWAGWVTAACDPADFGTMDPATGTSSAIPTGGWYRPISGLAFDYDTSTMFAVDGCGNLGNSELFVIDVTDGASTIVTLTPNRLGSLQFGPDGDLYAGGDAADGGNLYRIDATTGTIALVGPTGFGSVTGLMLVPEDAVAAEPVAAGQLFLSAPIPNPSRASLVRLDFTLPQPGSARLELYDVTGRRVWRKEMGSLPAGQHSAEWNGFTTSGRRVASGVYFVRLRTDVGEKRVTLVRLQ